MKNRPTWKSTAFILVVTSQALTLVGALTQYLTPEVTAVLTTTLTAVFAACNAWIKVNKQPE